MKRSAKTRAVTRSSSRYRVQVLDRAVQVLDILAKAGLELGPSEIAAEIGLHKSTIHRLLTVLEGHRLVHKNAAHGKYTLGMKLFELGSRSVAHIELRSHAVPFLQRLMNETQETAHVSVLDSGEMLSVIHVEGPWSLRLRSGVGRRSPVHCTSSGKCMLAFMPEHEMTELVDGLKLTRYTPRTIVTRAALKQSLGRIRERGFSLDDEELEAGLRCVGAPVRDHTGHVVGTISISGPVFRVTRERLPMIARSVVVAGRGLSTALGYNARALAQGAQTATRAG